MPSADRRRFCCDEDLARIGYDGLGDAAKQLARSGPMGRRSRPGSSSASLSRTELTGSVVLDIGAGVGAVHLALLEAGASRAVDVDASRDDLAAAREEAARRGLDDRVEYQYGDVVSSQREAATGRCRHPRLRHLSLPVSAGHARGRGQVQAEAGWVDVPTRCVVDAHLHAGVQRNARGGGEPRALFHPPPADRTEAAGRGGSRPDPRRRIAGLAGVGISAYLSLRWTRPEDVNDSPDRH